MTDIERYAALRASRPVPPEGATWWDRLGRIHPTDASRAVAVAILAACQNGGGYATTGGGICLQWYDLSGFELDISPDGTITIEDVGVDLASAIVAVRAATT